MNKKMTSVNVNFFNCEKAQGALEYVLLVAGVLILAVLVFTVVQGNFFKEGAKTSNETNTQIQDELNKARNN